MEITNMNIADNFMRNINTLSNETKLEIISRIISSMKYTENKATDSSWKELFGAYISDRDADDIISDLKANRYTNRQINEL